MANGSPSAATAAKAAIAKSAPLLPPSLVTARDSGAAGDAENYKRPALAVASKGRTANEDDWEAF